MRLLVKEVIVVKNLITIKPSIPECSKPTANTLKPSKSSDDSKAAQSDKSYALRKWRDFTDPF
jgi:hypothetical protein